MYKLVLVGALILMATAMDSPDATYLKGLAQNEFGRTLLSTIQLELEGNSSIDHILDLLRQMKESVEQEQDLERQKSRDHTQFCDDKYDEILFVLDTAAIQLAKDQNALPLYLEEQRDKARQLLDKQALEQRNLDRLQVLADERAITRGEYERRRDELTSMIGALQEGRRIISQLSTKKYDPLAGTYSFLEFAQPMFNHLEQHANRFMGRGSKHGLAQLYELLLQTAQNPGIQANQKGVAKIQEIIDSLVESIFDLQKKELIADNAREQDYQNQKERIELQNRRLEATIASFKARVEVINQTVLELTNDIKANTDKSVLMNKQKNDWEKTCVDYHNGYVEATKLRTVSSDILTEVIQLLQRHYDDLTGLLQMVRSA